MSTQEHGRVTGVQRVAQRLDKNYPTVRLYFDDAIEMVELLQKHCERVTIEAEGYKLDTLEAIKEIVRDKFQRLDLTGWKESTYISVVLSPSRAYATLSRDDDITLRGAFAQVEAILMRRSPYLRFLASQTAANIATGLILTFSCISIALSLSSIGQLIEAASVRTPPTLHFSGIEFGDVLRASVPISYVSYVVWSQITRSRNRSVVYLQRWHERTSFWERNKEEILRDVIVGAIVAAVTGGIGFVIGFLVGSQH